jgi:hypothetical protein
MAALHILLLLVWAPRAEGAAAGKYMVDGGEGALVAAHGSVRDVVNQKI